MTTVRQLIEFLQSIDKPETPVALVLPIPSIDDPTDTRNWQAIDLSLMPPSPWPYSLRHGDEIIDGDNPDNLPDTFDVVPLYASTCFPDE